MSLTCNMHTCHLQTCTMITCYTAWLFLSALAGYTAWQIHLTLIYLLTLVVQNPALRPVGWNTGTVGLWSRLSIFLMGALWLVAVMMMEQGLNSSLKEKRLMVQIGRYFVTMGIICLICYLLIRL